MALLISPSPPYGRPACKRRFQEGPETCFQTLPNLWSWTLTSFPAGYVCGTPSRSASDVPYIRADTATSPSGPGPHQAIGSSKCLRNGAASRIRECAEAWDSLWITRTKRARLAPKCRKASTLTNFCRLNPVWRLTRPRCVFQGFFRRA